MHTILAAHSSLATSPGVEREEPSGSPGDVVSLQTSQLLMNKSLESNLLEIIELFAKIYLSDMFVKVRGWGRAIRFG